MQNVIEVAVTGVVGSGNSHLLGYIAQALSDEYGRHVQAESHEVEAIFSLKDPQHCAESATPELKAEAMQGFVGGFMLDPLEQAIDQAVRLVAEAEGELAVKLSRHLDQLLAEQLRRVTA